MCAGLPATIVGTDGNDNLSGGPEDDVIAALGGDDDVAGGGGHDVICGGAGDDRLAGGDGNDTLLGGDGDDRIVGGDGADRLGGGPGNDQLSGGSGNDLIVGGTGGDRAVGGEGEDACEAEEFVQCERSASGTPNSVLSAVLTSPLPQTTVSDTGQVQLAVTSLWGIDTIELYLGDDLLARASDHIGPGSETRTVPVDYSQVRNGTHVLTAVVTDASGDRAVAEPVTVTVVNDLAPEGPSTGFIFNEPLTLSQLEPVLRSANIRVIEFFHERPAQGPTPIPTDLAALLAADGIVIGQPGSTITGGFYGRGLSLNEQIDSYRTGYQEDVPGQDPLVFGLRVENIVDASALGPFSGLVAETVPLEPAQEFSAAGERSLRQAVASESERTVPTKSGMTESDAAGQESPALRTDVAEAAAGQEGSALRTAAAAAEADGPSPWWPTFGQFDTREFTRVRRIPIPNPLPFGPQSISTTERRVKVTQDMVWTPAALASFDDGRRAYEHDLKIQGSGRFGLRPFCNPLTADNVYVHRSLGVIWNSTAPSSAAPYFDSDASDDCSIVDLTVGLARPERLDDALAEGRSPAIWFTIDARRGNQDASDLRLRAAWADKTGCGRVPARLLGSCVGLRGGGESGPILQTGGRLIPRFQIENGACFVWKWLPTGDAADGSNFAHRCGNDRDGDGYDDRIDCAPSDPAIHPGAVDRPNDGIDQDCDGRDLVVGSGRIQVTLIWDNEVDMDLHVIEPNGTRIWYSNPGPTSTGGRLDRDDNVCGTANRGPGGVENIFWPNESGALLGTYRVEVVQYTRCGQPAADWILEIRVQGELLRRETGSGGGFTTTFNSGP